MKTYVAVFEVPDDYRPELPDFNPANVFFRDANGEQRVVGTELVEVKDYILVEVKNETDQC